jgi:hypothetical protein
MSIITLTKQVDRSSHGGVPERDGAPELTPAMIRAGAITIESYSAVYHPEMLAAAVYTAMRAAYVRPGC